MKKLNSLKESLFIKEVSQKEMSKIKGGRAFSSVTMTQCKDTGGTQHDCSDKDDTDPDCAARLTSF